MTIKNYSVARIAQYTQDGIGKAERHIERKNKTYENMNVVQDRSERNVWFKSCGDLTYNEIWQSSQYVKELIPNYTPGQEIGSKDFLFC